ncbi:glycosyltransferase involved in cell wall biosynthesis [Loktanella ponticola]|uniref:Glycosyltransferase involved in cell wall biosynthesis n=1 Tax=Yoonia ponticola TaxID=1524255 RepID=A0A7W9BNZ6_9RHOB|nr:glycosyltransferase family 4 protein [Yoonia ponticola]MBB5723916.1 glycosyltransferase involved in cell wall biosynthesis [Yoonia ponticola]
MTHRAKVLLIAYACRPGESSERQVGWHWAHLIQRNHDVTVLTRESHRAHIEAWYAQKPKDGPRPEFIYYDLPKSIAWFKRGERGLYLYYALWSLLAVLRCRKMNKQGRWEITHFLTFGTMLWPQFGYLMNTRYLLGPVGGGERIPLSLRGAFRPAGRIKVLVRRLVQKLMVLNPIFLANLSRADRIFARTGETREMFPARYHHKTELLLETAIGPEMIPDAAPTRSNDVVHIVSVGRLITSKFNPLMLEALADFKAQFNRPFVMTIIGDGPERSRLETLRDQLGLTEVTFVGKKPSNEVFDALRDSDIYFSTTMKEGGTWAFFEAIANHLPIVCLKVNGPDMIVGDGCGVKVSPTSHAAAREGLAEGLLCLAEAPELRSTLAANALAHVEQTFTWGRVTTQIDAAYADLLATQGAAQE